MNEKKRFELFTKELANLSMKYKITIRCTGGVIIFEEVDDVKRNYIKAWENNPEMLKFIETVN